jgi:hypothetical protein
MELSNSELSSDVERCRGVEKCEARSGFHFVAP